MATIDCQSCEELRTNAPEFVQNEVTNRVCNSLKNNTGLNPSNSTKNCDDLNDANDCLIGRMAQDVEAYEVCDWKDFMKKFVGNTYNVIKAMLCWMCGIQNNIDKMWCWLHSITDTPKRYTLHAYEDDDPDKPAINGFRIVDGVRMRLDNNGSPILIRSMGNVCVITGSLDFEGNMPRSYTGNTTTSWKHLEHGCASLTNDGGDVWGSNGNAWTLPLVWEIQFKKCQLGFSSFFGRTDLHQASAGDFTFKVMLFQKGDIVPPDYSTERDNQGDYHPGYYTFNPSDDDMMLLQVRLQNTRLPLGYVSPGGNLNVISCPESLDC